MKIELLIFCSSLHDTSGLLTSREYSLDELKRYGEVEMIPVGNYIPGPMPEDSLQLCYIASGGSEEVFIANYEKLKGEIILLCDSFSNSLAATLEISTWLESRQRPHRVINIPEDRTLTEETIASVFKTAGEDAPAEVSSAQSIYDIPRVKGLLQKTVIGCIGGESSWLISSHIDKSHISRIHGTRFVDIGIQELLDIYQKAEEKDIISYPLYTRIGSESAVDLRKALKMTYAIECLVRKYGLTALTIKCFDLLDPASTTSCLALALLNDKGIVSGCEGDLPSLWTMIVGSCLYGRPMFMSNPSSADRRNLTIDFAHCTVPTTLLEDYSFMTHFESGIGVAIKGKMPSGKYLLLKIGGEKLDRIYRAEGKIIENTDYIYRCRTQIRFRFSRPEDFDRFFTKRLSNHTIIAPID